jgi:uncharacterized membrane protein YhaH (DUF805 family)
MRAHRSVFKTVVAPIVAVVLFIPTLAMAVREVLHGRGAATYSNVYGLAIPYTSVLILVLVLALVLAGAYVARLVYFWRNGHDGAAKLRKIESPTSPVDSGDGK